MSFKRPPSFKVVVLVVLILILLPGCLGNRPRNRANYGEFCDNRAIRCDSSLSLTCKNQTCVCLKPENMIYDPRLKSCASLAGEKCKFLVMEDYRSWQEEISCVSNAHCDFVQNICVCDKDYIELSNGTCIPKKHFNESCETTLDCKQDHSLICVESRCICNATISEYSEEQQQCVGLANEPCVNDLCTANAICREEPRRIYYGGTSVEIEVSSDEDYSDQIYPSHTTPSSVGRCQCRTAFGVTAGGRCLLGYGGKCDHEQAKCMEWLRCKEGTCVCQYPDHQVFDKSSESCLSIVGGPCTPPTDNNGEMVKNDSLAEESAKQSKISCISGTICGKPKNGHRNQCKCPEGFVENKERGCDLDYGMKCKTQQISPYMSSRTTSATIAVIVETNPKVLRCDRIGKLFCIDGTCQCEDNLHVYDKESRSCKGLVGALCHANDSSECIAHAYCKGRRGTETSEGMCTCRHYTKENENGTCTNPEAVMIPPHDQSQEGRLNVAGIALKSRGSYDLAKHSIWTLFNDTTEED